MKTKVDMSEHAEEGWQQRGYDEEDGMAMEVEQVGKSEANYSLETMLNEGCDNK